MANPKTAQGASVFRHVYAGLLAVWALAFGAETAGIAGRASAVSKISGRLDEAYLALNAEAQETVRLVRGMRSQSKELELLQSLPNVLPRDKGALRTQKVIADEVQKVRRKIAQRLKGSLHVIVDAKANKLYVKKGLFIEWQADCSVGRGGTLEDKKTGRRWEFVTPRGEFKVLGKSENPVWIKPDWAFVESKEPVPPPDDPARKVAGELGAYVLSLGDGYLIHGAKNESLLGRAVSHGCVRLGAEDLKRLYETVPAGTRVFIIY